MTYTSQIKAPFSDIFDKFTDLAATMRSDQARQVSLGASDCSPSKPPGGGVNFVILPRGIAALMRL
jgi:hypothetical protein